MSPMTLELEERAPAPARANAPVTRLADLGELVPLGRPGGQGRVYRPRVHPAAAGAVPVVVKLYRRRPARSAFAVLADMIAWDRSLSPDERVRLHRVTAWPLALALSEQEPVGIVMRDLSGRYELPFVMPSGRSQRVLLSLEHLLGADQYLQLRGLPISLDTTMRTRVAEQLSGALAFLHRHAIVVSDIAPSNLLVGFAGGTPSVCFIDCDSMVFRGRQALAPVETADWQLPPAWAEPPQTRAADAYKLGLAVLRLFARSHDARRLEPHFGRVPHELHGLLVRALGPDAANRPAAGEWQRALRQALHRGSLNERYPGPVPRPRAATRPLIPTRYESPPRPAPVGVGSAARGGARSGGPGSLSLAWLVLAAVVLVLLLARLLPMAAHYLNGSGLSGLTGGGRTAAPLQHYYTPYGQGSGSGLTGAGTGVP